MKKILALLSIVFLIGLPVLAVAQPADAPTAEPTAAVPAVVPGPDIDPGEAVGGVIEAASSKQWVLLIGFGLMTLVFVLRKFIWKKVNTKWLPWLAIGIAVLGAGSIALVADPSKWWEAILLGVESGLVAAGEWGILGVAREKLKERKKKKPK